MTLHRQDMRRYAAHVRADDRSLLRISMGIDFAAGTWLRSA
jgi:hypothetical protein